MSEQKTSDKYEVLSVKIRPDQAVLLNAICDTLGVNTYQIFQMFFYVLCKASSPMHEALVQTLDRYQIVSAHDGFKGVECYAKGYHVENDALINDEEQELVCCWTQQKHYVVPECVKRIADISANDFVETITVKQPVELTTYEPFCSDLNLRRVDFQAGVSGITDGTFYNCPKSDLYI